MLRVSRNCVPALLALFVALATSGCIQRYVALGDSYTAGPVIPVQQSNADIPGGCLQSDHNYPHLVAKELVAAQFADASCSGATTDDMTGAQDVQFGPNPPQFDRLNAQTK